MNFGENQQIMGFIKTENVSFSYDTGEGAEQNLVLSDITMQIEKGEFEVQIGSSSEDIRLTDLTGFLRVNPNYLGGLLKNRLGKNFHALLTERRLREAKIYLRLHRHLTVGHISSLCGFSDSNYFSLVFRRYCGMPPGKYRKLSGCE